MSSTSSGLVTRDPKACACFRNLVACRRYATCLFARVSSWWSWRMILGGKCGVIPGGQYNVQRLSFGQKQHQLATGDARHVRTHWNRMQSQMTDASGGTAITAIALHYHGHDWRHHWLRLSDRQPRTDCASIGGLQKRQLPTIQQWTLACCEAFDGLEFTYNSLGASFGSRPRFPHVGVIVFQRIFSTSSNGPIFLRAVEQHGLCDSDYG